MDNICFMHNGYKSFKWLFPLVWIIALVRLTVSSIGLLDTTIIGDILSLSIDPVEVEAQLGETIVAVLLDNTFGFFDVFFFGYWVPPIH